MGSGSLLRDRSKSIGGGPEQRGGESSVFEPLVRGGSFKFQLPVEVVILFLRRNWHTFDTIDNIGNSFQFQRTKTF